VSRRLIGKTQLSLDEIEKIATALDISVDQLMSQPQRRRRAS
jgi:transcriptional regulator with XRE-family HTH domain